MPKLFIGIVLSKIEVFEIFKKIESKDSSGKIFKRSRIFFLNFRRKLHVRKKSRFFYEFFLFCSAQSALPMQKCSSNKVLRPKLGLADQIFIKLGRNHHWQVKNQEIQNYPKG